MEPSYPLDVAGNVNTSGQYLVNGVALPSATSSTTYSGQNTFSNTTAFNGTITANAPAVYNSSFTANGTAVFGNIIAQTRVTYSNGIIPPYFGSTKYPGWALALNNYGNGWTQNYNNIKAQDYVYAVSTASSSGSNSLATETYGFNIPSTATILGVQVNVGRYQDSGGTADDSLCIIKGLGETSYCKASGTIPNTYTIQTYGGPSDMWYTAGAGGSISLTPADVNANNFGVSDDIIWEAGQSGIKSLYTDFYSMTIWYSTGDYYSTGYDLTDSTNSFNVKYKTGVMMSVSSNSIVYAGGFSGDGSRLTNVPNGSPFPAGVRFSTDPVAGSLVDFSTITTALNGKQPTGAYLTAPVALSAVTGVAASTDTVPMARLAGALSSTTTVPAALIDLSTVAAALNGKLSNASVIPLSQITGVAASTDTITLNRVIGVAASTDTVAFARIYGALSSTTTVPQGLINLSTVTTALAGVISSTATGYYPLYVASAAYAANGGSVVSTVTIDALPIGTFIQYGSTTAPSSYLYCDGTSYSTTTYSALYAVIGYNYGGSGANFTCDFRGMFARGLETSKTLDDESRIIGSTETDKFQGFKVTVGPFASQGLAGAANYASGTYPINNIAADYVPISSGTYGTPRTGLETRPKNIAVAVMVKYQNPVVNYNGLTSTNVYSGGNTFKGPTTFTGPTTASAPWAGAYAPAEYAVACASTSSGTSLTISGLVSSTTYSVNGTITIISGSATGPIGYIRFSGDSTTSRYTSYGSGYGPGGQLLSSPAQGNTSSVNLCNAAVSETANDYCNFKMAVQPVMGYPLSTITHGTAVMTYSSGGALVEESLGGGYTGNALTSITIATYLSSQIWLCVTKVNSGF